MEDSELATAFHEAGHAVTAYACGRESIGVTIMRRGEITGGFQLVEADGADAVWTEAVTCFGGLHAETRHRGEENTVGARSDFVRARELLEELRERDGRFDDVELERLVIAASSQAAELVEENWDAVEALAAALVVRKNIPGGEADDIIALAGGRKPRE